MNINISEVNFEIRDELEGLYRKTCDISLYGRSRCHEYAWIFENLEKKGCVLDIGCLESDLGNNLVNTELEVYGIDLRNPKEYWNKEIKYTFIKGDIRNSLFRDNFFNQVIAVSSIEHVGLVGYTNKQIEDDGDVKTIKEVKRILKLDGIFLLTFPFAKETHIEDHGTHQAKKYNEFDVKQLLKEFTIKEMKVVNNDWLIKCIKGESHE